MTNIKTLNSISPAALNLLDPANYNISDKQDKPDAILVRSANMHNIDFAENLMCIARAGAGTNNIPTDRCRDMGIVVFNTPGANAEAVKELVLCAMLLSARDVCGGIDWVKTIANEPDIPALVEKGKSSYAGPEIYGKTLGVIGLGAVGAKIAEAATALGMHVYGYDPYLSVESAWRLSSDIIHAKDLDTIYRESDYITIHVPFLDSTKHLINAEALAKMKTGVRIINLARAELVNDDDIIAAIDTGKVICYVTDFPNEKTVNTPGIIAIPHLGASTPESEDNCARMAVSQIADYIENGNIVNSVNMPSASMPRTGDPRVCIIHKNIPDMIAKITSAVSSTRANIENMINASIKGHPQAYTILDLQSLPDNLKDKIQRIDGVTRVRTIS